MMRLFALTLALMLTAPGGAHAQDILERFVGLWSSTGWLSRGLEVEPERGRCRVRAEMDPQGGSLTIRGRCAVSGGAGTMVLRLVDDGGGMVRAGVTSPAMDGTVQMAGKYTGDTLELSSRAGVPFDSVLYDLRSKISFQSESAFSLQDWISPGGAEQWRLVNDQNFVRKEANE